MDLHVLRCPEYDLTIFRKCLSVFMHVCPIENLCDAVGRDVFLRFRPPATLIELKIAQEEE